MISLMQGVINNAKTIIVRKSAEQDQLNGHRFME